MKTATTRGSLHHGADAAMADSLPQLAQVRLIQFSPEETFLVSYSPVEPANPREKAGLVLNIFDSRTGRKLRNFAGSAEDYAVGAAAAPGGALKWPVFQWAGGCSDRRALGECMLAMHGPLLSMEAELAMSHWLRAIKEQQFLVTRLVHGKFSWLFLQPGTHNHGSNAAACAPKAGHLLKLLLGSRYAQSIRKCAQLWCLPQLVLESAIQMGLFCTPRFLAARS